MNLTTLPLHGLMQEMLSSVKVGWGAEPGRINLTAIDELAQRWPASQVHCSMQRQDTGRRAVRIGIKDADRHLAELAERLFGTHLANFNAHNGHQANRAAFRSTLRPGDHVICTPDPELEVVADTLFVSATTPRLVRTRASCQHNGLIDYNQLSAQALAVRPRCLMAGYGTYTRHLDYPALRRIADSVGATLVIDISRIAGLIAAGLLANPLPYADVITGSTYKSLQGPRCGFFMTKDPGLFSKLNASLNELGHLNVPHRLKLALISCLRQADYPLQKARQLMSLENARGMAQAFGSQGLEVMYGGTDTQSLALNLEPLSLNHKQATAVLARLGISVERMATNQLHISTYPISARGMDAQACQQLAAAISASLMRRNELKTVAQSISTIDRLCADHPPLATALDYQNLQ